MHEFNPQLNPSASIIVPAYNAEKTILRCISSIKNQTFKNLELIIINDGSQDATEALCQNEASIDSRIIHVTQKNAGVSAARNLGISHAKGQYIFFVDADDFINENMIETMIKEGISTKANLVQCGVNFFGDTTKFSLKTATKLIQGAECKNYIQRFIEEGCGETVCWAKMYTAKIIKENNIKFPTKLVEDYGFNMIYMQHTPSMAFIKERLYNYQVENGSLSRKYNLEYIHSLNEIAEIKISLLLKKGVATKESRNKVSNWYFSMIFSFFEVLFNKPESAKADIAADVIKIRSQKIFQFLLAQNTCPSARAMLATKAPPCALRLIFSAKKHTKPYHKRLLNK